MEDPIDNSWHESDWDLIWGRGSVCIYSKNIESAKWLSECLVKQTDKIQNNENNDLTKFRNEVFPWEQIILNSRKRK